MLLNPRVEVKAVECDTVAPNRDYGYVGAYTAHRLKHDFADERKYASGEILKPALAAPLSPAAPWGDIQVFGSVTLDER